jgi:hypothetical protein
VVLPPRLDSSWRSTWLANGNFLTIAVAFLNCELFGSVSMTATNGVSLGT